MTLTREQLEEFRSASCAAVSVSPKRKKLINALCDLALAALERPHPSQKDQERALHSLKTDTELLAAIAAQGPGEIKRLQYAERDLLAEAVRACEAEQRIYGQGNGVLSSAYHSAIGHCIAAIEALRAPLSENTDRLQRRYTAIVETQSTIGERLRAKGYADVPSSSAHKHHANTAAPAARDSRKLSEIVPTTWLDPMLTGPNAALTPGVYYNDNDIERLLSAVKKRIEDAEVARDAVRAAP